MTFKTHLLTHRRRAVPVISLLLLPLCSLSVFAASTSEKTEKNGTATSKNPIQRPLSPKTAAAQAARDAALKQRSYVLGPGDVLRVIVPNFPEFSVDTMTVLPNGTVALPFYGTMKVNNRSIDDVQSQLRRQLVKRIKPQFANSLVLSVPQPRPLPDEPEFVPVYMQVLGNVKTPGQVEIKDGYRISEVIGVVGGPSSGRLDNVKVALARAGQPLRDIDLVEISKKLDSPANIEVRPLDVITVTEIQEEPKPVYLTGAVNRQGTYYIRRLPQPGAPELGEEPHLSELLLLAGGLSVPAPVTGTVPIENGAYDYKAILVRANQTLDLKVQDALSKADPAADITLQPRDYINVTLVPPVTVRVDGLVRAPGQFQMKPGVRFVDALVKAGGPTRDNDEIVASVWRGGREFPIDLKNAIVSNDPRFNLVLENNDVLQIQEPDSLQITVSGAVAKPQLSKFPIGTKLLDAILASGDLTPGVKREQTIFNVFRHQKDGKTISLNIDPIALYQLKPEQNIELLDGDFITVTEVKPEIKYVSIGGEVNKQGVVEFDNDLDLYDLIVRAGGPTTKAALSRVVVQRDGKTQMIDAYDAVKNGKPLNFAIQSRDLVTIPEHTDHVTVMEAVNRPGPISIPEKGRLTLSEAIAAAGGRQVNARDIVLIRPRAGQPNNPEMTIIEPNPTGKNAKANPQQLQQELQNGDVVWVNPGKVTEPKSRTILSFLGPLGLLLR